MQPLAASTKVKIAQGHGIYSLGKVISYSPDANRLGNKCNYQIEITGGKNCFGKPAQIGEIKTVLASHVTVMHLAIVA